MRTSHKDVGAFPWAVFFLFFPKYADEQRFCFRLRFQDGAQGNPRDKRDYLEEGKHLESSCGRILRQPVAELLWLCLCGQSEGTDWFRRRRTHFRICRLHNCPSKQYFFLILNILYKFDYDYDYFLDYRTCQWWARESGSDGRDVGHTEHQHPQRPALHNRAVSWCRSGICNSSGNKENGLFVAVSLFCALRTDAISSLCRFALAKPFYAIRRKKTRFNELEMELIVLGGVSTRLWSPDNKSLLL